MGGWVHTHARTHALGAGHTRGKAVAVAGGGSGGGRARVCGARVRVCGRWAYLGLARLPMLGQRRLEPLPCDPPQVVLLRQAHAEPLCVFLNLGVGRLIVLVDVLFEDDRLHRAAAGCEGCSPPRRLVCYCCCCCCRRRPLLLLLLRPLLLPYGLSASYRADATLRAASPCGGGHARERTGSQGRRDRRHRHT